MQEYGTPNNFVNFKTSKWVKLGTLLITPERKSKENSLATARVPNKNNRVASRKALSL